MKNENVLPLYIYYNNNLITGNAVLFSSSVSMLHSIVGWTEYYSIVKKYSALESAKLFDMKYVIGIPR